MIGSLVVGMLATLLGAVCISAGVAVAVVGAVHPAPSGAFASAADIEKIGKVVVDVLKAFGKLKPSAQLLVVGMVMFGAGIWLLSARPF